MSTLFRSSYSIAFLYAMAMPTFHVYLGSSGVLVVNGMLIFGLGSYLLIKHFCGDEAKLSVHNTAFVFFIVPLLSFLLLIPISMSVGVIFGDIFVVERDFYEFHKPVLHILVFIFTYLHFSRGDSYKNFEVLLIIIFLLLLLFGLNHFLRIFDFVNELYTKPHNISSKRISVPFVNPYDYAFFMSFFVFYFMFKTLLSKIVYFPLFFLAIILLLLTQSRSVAAGLTVALFIFVPIAVSLVGLRITTNKFCMHKGVIYIYVILSVVLFFFLLSIQFWLDNFSYLASLFIKLIETGEISRSGQIRIDQFNFALAKASEHPLILLFGNGPAKAEMEHVESIYNYLFYRYGLVGLILYFSILSSAIIMCWRIIKLLKLSSTLSPLFLAMLLWLVATPILSIGNNFTEQVRTSFFYYSVIGIVLATYPIFYGKYQIK